jgi:hypothetical protein
MKKLFIIKIIGFWMLACMFTGCMEEKEFTVDQTIYVNHPSLNLFFGDKFQLTASPASDSFEWSSEDDKIAKVNSNGEVEATGVGTTNIIAGNGTVRKVIPVKVTIPMIDKVTACPGRNRVQLELSITSNLIKSVEVVRLDNDAKFSTDINFQSGLFTVYYPGLPESKYNFEVYSYDKYGNRSEALTVASAAYGEQYQSKLTNRGIRAASVFGNGLCMSFYDHDGNWSEFTYANKAGIEVSVNILRSENATYLFDYGSGALKYRAAFLPEPTAVDTFYTEIVEYSSFNNKVPVFSAANPCEIQIRDFDIGGEGVGYHDNDAGNSGGNYAYRENLGDFNSRDVDIEGGLNIGYTNAGEWLMYTVTVEDAGDYIADMNLSVNRGGGSMYSLVVDDVKTDVFYIDDNQNWGDYRWYHERNPDQPQPVISLTEGTHKVKFYFEEGGFNIMSMKFTYK